MNRYLIIIFLACGLLVGCSNPERGVQAARLLTETATAEETDLPVKTAISETLADMPPDSCPVSSPQEPGFQPPPPYSPESPYPGEFWYGSNDLWTLLPTDGRWYALPFDNHGYSQKVVWWSEGYRVEAEPQPELAVSGRRLDAEAPPLQATYPATNGFNSEIGEFMLVGVEIPTPGCWEISGKYHGTTLTFVVWVAPGTE